MRSGEETGLASCTAGSNRVLFTASSAAWSSDSWPDEERTTADTTVPVSSMSARMVTTPSHPARFALRGYTGRISPRGLGARVVGPAAPGCAPPGTPTALTPLPLAVPAVSPPLAPVAPPPSVAALETCAWSLAPEEPCGRRAGRRQERCFALLAGGRGSRSL